MAQGCKQPPHLPSALKVAPNRKVSPWFAAKVRSETHDESGSDALGAPKPDALLVDATYLDFKPRTHQIHHADVLGYIEFKKDPSHGDIRDAMEQSLLEVMIQKDLNPIAGNSIFWIADNKVIRAYYANVGVVLRLRKVEFRNGPIDFLELLFLTLSFVSQKGRAPSQLRPGTLLKTVDGQHLEWETEISSDDVLYGPFARSIPYRFGGKAT